MIKCAMENRIVFVTLILWFVFALAISGGCKKKEQPEETQQAVPAEETKYVSASEKIDLRILYAGLLETDRAKDFVAFLAAHFEKVETTDYLTFKGTESAGFDVTIIDHDGSDFDAPRLRLSPQYAHAAIAVGVPGAFLCSGLRLKTGYL